MHPRLGAIIYLLISTLNLLKAAEPEIITNPEAEMRACFEAYQNRILDETHPSKILLARSVSECLSQCIQTESEGQECSSALFYSSDEDCSIIKEKSHLTDPNLFIPENAQSVTYFYNLCAKAPTADLGAKADMNSFKGVVGRIRMVTNCTKGSIAQFQLDLTGLEPNDHYFLDLHAAGVTRVKGCSKMSLKDEEMASETFEVPRPLVQFKSDSRGIGVIAWRPLPSLGSVLGRLFVVSRKTVVGKEAISCGVLLRLPSSTNQSCLPLESNGVRSFGNVDNFFLLHLLLAFIYCLIV